VSFESQQVRSGIGTQDGIARSEWKGFLPWRRIHRPSPEPVRIPEECGQEGERRRERNNPKTAEAIPPVSIHMDLSVGLPVKNRETSELKESAALIPNIVNTIPTTSSTIPNDLFMIHPFVVVILILVG
jgi:hypothetical protein